jgi:uncharacterized membrane protein
MRKKKHIDKVGNILVVSVLATYFMFTSGFVYEAINSEVTDRLEVPYSIALSAERIGIAGVFNGDDMECAKWIVDNITEDSFVVADYNVHRLVVGVRGMSSKLFDVYKGKDAPSLADLPDEGYVFLSTWNVERGKYVTDASIGTRFVLPLPDFSNYPVAFQKGKSVICRIGE